MYSKVYKVYPRAFKSLVTSILEDAAKTAPRGHGTYEVVDASLLLENPLDRIVMDRNRMLNPGFMIAEWVAMMTGVGSLDFFLPHIKSYGRYSSDGKTVDGAYGPRVNADGNQFEKVINILQDDPHSRRAVVTIFDGKTDLSVGALEVPCTLGAQFLIRDNVLDAYFSMRSNDVWNGLTYDIFQFTMAHEYVARRLGCRLGAYHHRAGSLHIYERDLPELEKLGDKRWPHVMPSMPTALPLLLDDLMRLRDALFVIDEEAFWGTVGKLRPYTTMLAMTARAFVMRHDPEEARLAFSGIRDITMRRLVRYRLVKTGALPRRATDPE